MQDFKIDKIKIFAHRGCWDQQVEPNSKEAITIALKKGFSVETDIRDYGGGEIGISHEPINNSQDKILSLTEYLEIFNRVAHQEAVSALNIKADGLDNSLIKLRHLLENEKFFFFDGSFPCMKKLIDSNFRCLDRISEFETPSNYLFNGLWVDAFQGDWIINNEPSKFQRYPTVIFVSPELHGRPHMKLWIWLKSYAREQRQEIGICTDMPDQAREFFND